MATCVWEHLHVWWFPFTHIMVCVKGQEPPTRDLIKLKLWVNKRQSAELCQKESHSLPKDFFFPFKEHFSLRITSHLAGLTYILTLEVIRANHWSWEGGFLHLNKAIQVLQSVNPWKALRFHSLTCLINMEIVKMFWLVKTFSAFLKLALAPTCTKCWLGMPRSLHHLLYCVYIDNPWSINKSYFTKKCLFYALKGTLLSQGNKNMAKGGKRVCTKKCGSKEKTHF